MEFNPQVEKSGIDTKILEAPNIEYDIKEINPGVMEIKKWDLIYKIIVFFTIIILFIV
jgi:hypothetical protein